MKKAIFLILLSVFVFMNGCSNKIYEDGYSSGYNDGYQAAIKSSTVVPVESSAPLETETKISVETPEPENGFIFEEIINRECVAPLRINTTGEGGYYFVIDPIEFPVTGENEFYRIESELAAKYFEIRFYVRAGSTVNIDVPLGKYEIYYAYGNAWYGESDLFGPETTYFKCDDIFVFEETSSGYDGWTISLKPTINGNLDTDQINESDFPKNTK